MNKSYHYLISCYYNCVTICLFPPYSVSNTRVVICLIQHSIIGLYFRFDNQFSVLTDPYWQNIFVTSLSQIKYSISWYMFYDQLHYTIQISDTLIPIFHFQISFYYQPISYSMFRYPYSILWHPFILISTHVFPNP